jgi:hypothetical protein
MDDMHAESLPATPFPQLAIKKELLVVPEMMPLEKMRFKTKVPTHYCNCIYCLLVNELCTNI